MSELEQYYEACQAGMFAREDASECGCGGCGWFLSQVDTWHSCPVHFAGQAHPEDDRDDAPMGSEPPDAPEDKAPVYEDDDIPF